MRRAVIFFAAVCLLTSNVLKADDNTRQLTISDYSSLPLSDWREGVYNRNVSEHLALFNIEVIPVITNAFKETTPWAFGFNIGYQYKIRPSVIHSKLSYGFGLNIGVTRYFGKDIDAVAIGSETLKQWDSYKSYTNIPIMAEFDMYYNFKRSGIFIGVSAGINLMLGQRDARVDSIGRSVTQELEDAYNLAHGTDISIISIQKDENEVSLNHVIPTFRFHIGYIRELTANWRLRALAGVEYQMKYSDEYKGFRMGTDYFDYYHQHDSPSMLNPFISVGVAYSL